MANAQRFRARKVDLKRSLPVYRASDLDDLEDDDNRQVDAIETGVEKDEEAEHHLQAAISATLAAASGSAPVKSVYIPTPDASQVTKEYEALYARAFSCPHSLIRSSETVEESCAPMYCADDEDMEWIKRVGMDVGVFEAAMDALEALTRDMIFTCVEDVPTLEYLLEYAAERDRPLGKKTTQAIYDYWRQRRAQNKFKPIIPQLQRDDLAHKAEIDPFVCFRRREVRQGRKTRRADQRSLEQLRKLRINLASVSQLLEMCGEREREKTQWIECAQEVAQNRRKVLKMRRRLNVSGDGDDLFVPPQQALQKKRTVQRPRAAPARKPRVTGVAMAQQSEAGVPQPFVLPRTVSVPLYPVPKRYGAMGERIRARLLSYKTKVSQGWVDSTFAVPAQSGVFWKPPCGEAEAFRLRVGRLGRLFVDRRSVRVAGKDGRGCVVQKL
ncbi:Enhancer of polycomb-like protein 1, partial [Kickxella alabastrina]